MSVPVPVTALCCPQEVEGGVLVYRTHNATSLLLFPCIEGSVLRKSTLEREATATDLCVQSTDIMRHVTATNLSVTLYNVGHFSSTFDWHPRQITPCTRWLLTII